MRITRQRIYFPLPGRALSFLALILSAWAAFTALACVPQGQPAKPLVSGVASVGMTVEDLDRSVEFYSRVLSFIKIRELEVAGDSWEHLEGVFGLRIRVARLQLGS